MSVQRDRDATQYQNPFSTRFVRPGAIEYVFEDQETTTSLIDRLAALGWWAQIIGPHGSGKSTLLAALAEPLAKAGRCPSVFSLHDGQRRLPSDWASQVRRMSARMIIIDGYEQLSRLSRFWVKLRCRRWSWGLLITAHADVGLPTLLRTAGKLTVAQAVVERLMPDGDAAIDTKTVAERFAASHGNVRDTLFALYDVYEARHRRS